MNFEEIYQKILSDLALGHRGLVRFSSDQMDELQKALQIELRARNEDKIKILLCLIEHSSVLNNQYETILLEALNLDLSDQLKIFALNCARKHIIEARFQKGHRLDFNFLEVLKKFLHSNSPELVEWTLRTIEGCGNQGVYFLREFDKIKPAPWKWFNPHQRAVREIITLLERRWSQFERIKS